MSLSLDEYQENTAQFARYPGQNTHIGLTYAVIGLNGEAGETGEAIKKLWRDEAADIEGACLEALRGLESCNLAHGLRPDHFEAAREQIKAAFRIPISDERREKIQKELGDTLWYASQLATELGLSLGDVAQDNLDKLSSRRERNVIHGEGSDR